MGNGMNKVLPGLYVGNYRDSKDLQQLTKHNITHILSIHDSPRRLHPDKHYLCVMAADTPEQNLSQYFAVCNDFIHAARLRDGNVLIHCLAGMSRSVTVTVAYIMTVTPMNWRDALKVVRSRRNIANPNSNFQGQLEDFESNRLVDERKRLKERYPSYALEDSDRRQCDTALIYYEQQLFNRSICEGQCVRGENCPTGLCNSSPRILRRRTTSTASTRIKQGTSASCPNSPRRGRLSIEGRSSDLDGLSEDEVIDIRREPASSSATSTPVREPGTIYRSASTTSATSLRPRSSPAGLYSYTGSAPSSVAGSMVNLTNQGSAIYVGFTPNARGSVTASNLSINASTRQRSSSQLSVCSLSSTPPGSPQKSRTIKK